MAFRYTIRNLDGLGEPSKARGLAVTCTKLWRRLRRATSGPYTLEHSGEAFHHQYKTAWAVTQRVRELMKQTKGPDRVIIHPKKEQGGPDFAVREFERQERVPVADGPGTAQVDQIHAYILNWCKEKGWPVTELGICVNKPGEHGYCNAWDGGCIYDEGKMLSSDEIHHRILAVASEIRAQGIAYQNHNGGLPVNGVIVMEQYWEHGMGLTWNHYSGIPHSTHWHVSGYPSKTGWV